MNCDHPRIITFRTLEGEPVMWACGNCKTKFVPITQLFAEVADEREACAKVCEEFAADANSRMQIYGEAAAAEKCAAAIRNREET